MSDSATDRVPVRREPPEFRRCRVVRIDDVTPRLRRFVLGGPELDGMVIDEPAASVRLLLPLPGAGLEMPTWTGNQFELSDGSRAPIRTFTPRHFDTASRELTIDIVVHDGGAASDWAADAAPGDEVAISGPGRGYAIDTDVSSYLLAGDETALPAMCQLVEAMPSSTAIHMLIEVADPAARLDLPTHDHLDATWLDLPTDSQPGAVLFEAITALEDLPAGIWVAGEAAAVQKIRTHLFDDRGLSRADATVRGYWKQGRSAT